MLVRVLTHNIHKGLSPLCRRTIGGLREEIRATGADLVFLQEVRGAYRPHGDGPQHEYLADSVWSDHCYGRNAVYRNGHHGNAILSRFPLVEQHNQDISLNRLERRGLLHAETALPDGGPLHLFCLHLNLRHDDRVEQLELVIRHLERALAGGQPAILAGDFNDWQGALSAGLSDSLGLRDAAEVAEGRHARTYPSYFPLLRLDRIYFRGLALESFQVLSGPRWRRLSDHLAMTATFRI